MEFQLSYFKSWKMMSWKCCTQYASKSGKLSSGHRLEKVSFHSNSKERQCKECSNYCTIALISHTSKVMLKILQARLQQYMNYEFPDVQAGFRKGRGTRDRIANLCWIIEKAREFQNNKELTHWKRPWCWERWKAGGEGDDRRWDGWMASPTQWTWVWVNSVSWWWTGRPGVLQFMGSQIDTSEQLNWTECHLVF